MSCECREAVCFEDQDDEDGDEVPVPFAPGAPRGRAFAGASRNYLLATAFKPGFMYKVTGSPSVILILENKILVGREGRPHFLGKPWEEAGPELLRAC